MNGKIPTVENLKSLYESELYQNLLSEFAERSNRELDNREYNSDVLYSKLGYCQRRYQLLNVPFEEILSAFEKNKDRFLDYQISATAFFSEQDKNIEFGLPESELISDSGIDKTYFLERFCEFYLLQSDKKERLIHYIGTRKVKYIGKYAEQITQLYNQNISSND
jgi:hypothetical protein